MTAPNTFLLEIVTPEKVFLSKEVEMAVLHATDGQIGIMPLHAPLITTLGEGTVDIYADNKVVEQYTLHGGFVEMNDNKCVVLAESAVAV
jgi:F-type H+-transporting ATPase subunit epsilon